MARDTYPWIVAKDLEDVGDVLDGIADDEDEYDEERNVGKPSLSLT